MRQGLRRVPVIEQASAPQRHRSFPAPIGGWVTAESLVASNPATARKFDNFFAERHAVRLRRGISKKATLTAGSTPVTSMFTYRAPYTEKLFAADATKIWDISNVADPDTIPTDPVVTDQTSGLYVSEQMGTAGGDYMYAVNGDDPALLYDGTDWFEITDEATYGLAYDAETGAFTVGQTVSGGTSGASATIVRVIDNGTTGVLWVKAITSGPFADNETITDGATGSATSDIPAGVSTIQSITITGVDTSLLSFVKVFANRLWFVEDGTLDVWYLPVDSLGGAATKFSFKGIFGKGGRILFLATWSSDSGDGLDDRFVVVTSEGEAVVYVGTDPSAAATWQKVGLFRLPKPLGRKAVLRTGGDLAIATDEGIIPFSQVVQKDPSALSLSAVSAAIEPDWKREASARVSFEWEMHKWAEKNMAVVTQPRDNDNQTHQCLVVNLETGAWARYTGWDVHVAGYYDGFLYFGSKTGKVYQMEVSGSDDGSPYTGFAVGQFDHLEAPDLYKTVHDVRAIFRAAATFTYKLSGSVNYVIEEPSAPNANLDPPTEAAAAVWDVGLWDESIWDEGGENLFEVKTHWRSINRGGYSFAFQLQITSGTTLAPTIEWIGYALAYDVGGLEV